VRAADGLVVYARAAFRPGYPDLVQNCALYQQVAIAQCLQDGTPDTVTTLGPELVIPDELAPWRTDTAFDLLMTVQIKGVPVGEDRMSSMAFSFGDMVAYAWRGTGGRPGDVLGSGTCGRGCLAELWGRRGMDSHPPLGPGDVVTVGVEQLGTISTQVVAGVGLIPIPHARRGR
jgi:2-keto-4-pentenoate hydratase/2-oxohepta-3-ene-1,7-dioic acid hydratase in catechol pathway